MYVKSSLSGFTCIWHDGTPNQGLLPGVCLERGPMSPSSKKAKSGVAGGGAKKRWPVNHLFAANSLRLRGLQDQTSWREQQGPTFPQPRCSRLTCPGLGQISRPAQGQVTWRESPSRTVRSWPALRPPDFPSQEGALLLSHPCLILVTQQGWLSRRPKPSTLPGSTQPRSPLNPAGFRPHSPLTPAAY